MAPVFRPDACPPGLPAKTDRSSDEVEALRPRVHSLGAKVLGLVECIKVLRTCLPK